MLVLADHGRRADGQGHKLRGDPRPAAQHAQGQQGGHAGSLLFRGPSSAPGSGECGPQSHRGALQASHPPCSAHVGLHVSVSRADTNMGPSDNSSQKEPALGDRWAASPQVATRGSRGPRSLSCFTEHERAHPRGILKIHRH